MNPLDVQEAIQSLQQFLLDEYGWDTKITVNQEMETNPLPEQSSESKIECLPTDSKQNDILTP